MEKHKGGRPTKFYPTRIEQILDAISCHVPYKIAAEANGIAERTLFYWIKRGRQDMEQEINSEFTKFLQSLRKIESEKIMAHIELIRSSARGHKGSQ